MYEELRQEVLKLIINHDDVRTCELAIDALRAITRWEENTAPPKVCESTLNTR